MHQYSADQQQLGPRPRPGGKHRRRVVGPFSYYRQRSCRGCSFVNADQQHHLQHQRSKPRGPLAQAAAEADAGPVRRPNHPPRARRQQPIHRRAPPDLCQRRPPNLGGMGRHPISSESTRPGGLPRIHRRLVPTDVPGMPVLVHRSAFYMLDDQCH